MLIAQNKTESLCLASPSEINVSFFSSLLKLKESMVCSFFMWRDNRWKRALISVLGHAWARLSFSLWTGRAEQQSNLIVINFLLAPLHVQICPFLPQFPYSLWALLPAWEGRAKPLYVACWWQPPPHHLALDPTAGLPALLLSGDLEVFANSSNKIPSPTPRTISQTIIQHHISSSQPWFSWLRDS